MLCLLYFDYFKTQLFIRPIGEIIENNFLKIILIPNMNSIFKIVKYILRHTVYDWDMKKYCTLGITHIFQWL